MPAGRPSTYSIELADEICERLSEGEPMAQICRSGHMPNRSTVHRWGEASSEFAQRIARARDDGHDAIASRVRLTARKKGPDEGGDSTGDVQRDKLIIETDLKLLAKWDPKRYGDKTLVGSDPDNPLPPGFQVYLVKNDGADEG